MTRSRDHVDSISPRRARRELTAAWQHLVTAAGHGARQVGHTSHSHTKLARERTAAAAEAVRDGTRVAINSATVVAHQATGKVRDPLARHNSADKPAPARSAPPSPDGVPGD